MRAGHDGWMSSTRLEVLMPRMHNLQSNRVRVEVEGGERRGGSRGLAGGGAGEREKLRICLLPPGREERDTEIDIENFSAFIMHMSRKRMPMENAKHKNERFVFTFPQISSGNPVTRNRTRDHLIAA